MSDRPPSPDRRTPYHLRRDFPHRKTVLGWVTCVVGLGLFAASNVASRAGVVILPFDQHHLFGQAGGLILTVTGLIWATRPRR